MFINSNKYMKFWIYRFNYGSRIVYKYMKYYIKIYISILKERMLTWVVYKNRYIFVFAKNIFA